MKKSDEEIKQKPSKGREIKKIKENGIEKCIQ